MNRLLVIAGLLTSGLCFAQTPPLPMVDGKINFSEVVTVEGAAKDALYSRAKLWFADAFKSSNYVIQLDDRDAGVILGKGTLRLEERGTTTVVKTWGFTVKVQMKEGRYKAELYGIDYRFEQPEFSHKPYFRPVTHNLDSFFADPRMYAKNGGLKDGAPTNIATWTRDNFTAILANLNEAMTVATEVDDF